MYLYIRKYIHFFFSNWFNWFNIFDFHINQCVRESNEIWNLAFHARIKKNSWVRRQEVQFNVVNVSVRLFTNWIAVCQSPCLPSCFPVDARETARPFPKLLPAKADRTRGTMLFCGRAAEECWGGVILQGWSEFSFIGTVDGHFIRLISWDAKYPAIYTAFVPAGEHQILSISWFFQYGWYQELPRSENFRVFFPKNLEDCHLQWILMRHQNKRTVDPHRFQQLMICALRIQERAFHISTFASRHF